MKKYLGAYGDKIRDFVSVVKHQTNGKAYYDGNEVYVEKALKLKEQGFTVLSEPGKKEFKGLVRESAGLIMHSPDRVSFIWLFEFL